MRQQLSKNIANKHIPASLDQKITIAETREANNELIDQIFSSLITLAISYGMTAIGFKTAGLFLNSFSYGTHWIANERDEVALSWLQSLARQFPQLIHRSQVNTEGLIGLYHAFQKIIIKWDAVITHTSPADMLKYYGENNALLIKLIYKDIGDVLGTQDETIISKFFKIGEYANKQGIFNIELKFTGFLACFIPAFRHAILEPALKPILHHIYNIRSFGEATPNQLSEIKANDIIASLKKEYLHLKKWTRAGVMLNYFLTSIALSISFDAYYLNNKWPAQEYMIFIAANAIKILIHQLQQFYRTQKHIKLERKLTMIEKSFKEVLAFTEGEIQLHRTRHYNDCYLTFRAHKYQSLSDVLVNQIVKNILHKNNITIIDYSKVKHSFIVCELSAIAIISIKSQIEEAFALRIAIKLNGPIMMNQLSLSSSNILPQSSAVKEENNIDITQAAQDYFAMLPQKNQDALNLENALQMTGKKIQTLGKNRFAVIQQFRFSHLQQQYTATKAEEKSILDAITHHTIMANHKKLHLHVTKKITAMQKHLTDIHRQCDDYIQQRKDNKKTSATHPQYIRNSSQPALQANSNILFAPTANERIRYETQMQEFAFKLQAYSDFKADDTYVGLTIQVQAIFFEIIQFMKLRVTTHVISRKDPCLHFSKHIAAALTHTKAFIEETADFETVTLLHAQVIEFSQSLISAVAFDNFKLAENNGFCALLLAHGNSLDQSPETVDENDSTMYSLITGSLFNRLRDHSQPLPEGMLYSALRMVNLKAEIYDGYVQPLGYLEKIASHRTIFKAS